MNYSIFIYLYGYLTYEGNRTIINKNVDIKFSVHDMFLE